jgi:hypothetical protein
MSEGTLIPIIASIGRQDVFNSTTCRYSAVFDAHLLMRLVNVESAN